MKKVLITGSSRGIGREIALVLAAQGFQVVVNGRKPSKSLEETLAQLGKKDRALSFDVANREQSKQVLEREIKDEGAFWGVVLAAGLTKDKPFPGMEEEEWDLVLETNLSGFYNVLRPLIMPMIQLRQGGRIVPIASISGIVGNRGQVNYSAAKAGLIGASKALSRELAKRKIAVNCVAPGGVDTEMIDENLRSQMIKTIPMGRLASPCEIAGSVRYLFSKEAEYMTGQTLVLNGGMF